MPQANSEEQDQTPRDLAPYQCPMFAYLTFYSNLNTIWTPISFKSADFYSESPLHNALMLVYMRCFVFAYVLLK